LLKSGFAHSAHPGTTVGLANPVPVTGIVAYDANRTLDAIAAQVKELDRNCADIQLRPDFVAVIGQGIIAPRTPLRGEFNSYQLPSDPEQLVEVRKTGRHTLLRLYMQILRELNTLILRPLDLHLYDDMPRLVGPYRVRRHDRFVRSKIDASEQRGVYRLNEVAIKEIVSNSKPVTFRQHLLNQVGAIPLGVEQLGWDLDSIVYEYNPNNHPPISLDSIKRDTNGRLYITEPPFQAVSLEIDGKMYAVDLSALKAEHFDNNPDFTPDELMSI
jgi:hypothetical protein